MGVGTNIKEILRDRKMTIKHLSEQANIPLNTLYSITKRDSERVDKTILNRIAAVLNCDPYSLMSFDMASDAIFNRINVMEQINRDCEQLNDEGVKLVAEVAHITVESPRYRATSGQEAAEATPAVPEGKDAPRPLPPPESPKNGG